MYVCMYVCMYIYIYILYMHISILPYIHTGWRRWFLRISLCSCSALMRLMNWANLCVASSAALAACGVSCGSADFVFTYRMCSLCSQIECVLYLPGRSGAGQQIWRDCPWACAENRCAPWRAPSELCSPLPAPHAAFDPINDTHAHTRTLIL